jgi:ligand-binding SRPBCC domain-containing protein
MEHRFITKQFLPLSVTQAWDFFSKPGNLSLITPPEMEFRILTTLGGDAIYEGMRIRYIVRPFGNIPLHWETEIGKTIPLAEFTDKQLKGPYKKWEHRHVFTPLNNGTLVTDEVVYQLPFGFLGGLAHRFFVKKRIEAIFRYREETLIKLFPHI